MELADLILSLLPARGSEAAGVPADGSRPDWAHQAYQPRRGGRGYVVAFVGAGGKTSALYGLAEEFADHGDSVLVSTTTKIYDPRIEGGRRFDRLELAPALATGVPDSAGIERDRAPDADRGAARARVEAGGTQSEAAEAAGAHVAGASDGAAGVRAAGASEGAAGAHVAGASDGAAGAYVAGASDGAAGAYVGAARVASALERIAEAASPGEIVLLASAALSAESKLAGVDGSALCALAGAFDWVLAEADGARRLSVKAPGPGEPVVPPCTDLVVGCIGLDCLGLPVGPGTVHRSERFGPLVGTRPGAPIEPAQLLALALSPDGLFKSAPAAATRLLALNKADIMSAKRLEELLDFFASGAPLPTGEDDAPKAVRGSTAAFDAVAGCSFAAARSRVAALRRTYRHTGGPESILRSRGPAD